MKKLTTYVWLAVVSAIVVPESADAKGCIKGAIVGGLAGHFVGHHGILGAAAGCVAGHHEADKNQGAQPQGAAKQTDGQPAK
jgi:outer membrane lipoprotein SlyB